jgi:hypothetical protein
MTPSVCNFKPSKSEWDAYANGDRNGGRVTTLLRRIVVRLALGAKQARVLSKECAERPRTALLLYAPLRPSDFGIRTAANLRPAADEWGRQGPQASFRKLSTS